MNKMKVGSLVHYYHSEKLYKQALESETEFEKKALADFIIDLQTNCIIKNRLGNLEDVMDLFYVEYNKRY